MFRWILHPVVTIFTSALIYLFFSALLEWYGVGSALAYDYQNTPGFYSIGNGNFTFQFRIGSPAPGSSTLRSTSLGSHDKFTQQPSKYTEFCYYDEKRKFGCNFLVGGGDGAIINEFIRGADAEIAKYKAYLEEDLQKNYTIQDGQNPVLKALGAENEEIRGRIVKLREDIQVEIQRSYTPIKEEASRTDIPRNYSEIWNAKPAQSFSNDENSTLAKVNELLDSGLNQISLNLELPELPTLSPTATAAARDTARAALGLIPLVNDAADVTEFITGRDFFTNEVLDPFEVACAGFGIFFGSRQFWSTLARYGQDLGSTLKYYSLDLSKEQVQYLDKIRDLTGFANLEKANGGWKTPGGIYFSEFLRKRDDLDDVDHVLKHFEPNPRKPTDTVFDLSSSPYKSLVDLLDETWKRKGEGIVDKGLNVYVVETGKKIGYNPIDPNKTALTRLYIVEKDGRLITAHPTAEPPTPLKRQ